MNRRMIRMINAACLSFAHLGIAMDFQKHRGILAIGFILVLLNEMVFLADNIWYNDETGKLLKILYIGLELISFFFIIFLYILFEKNYIEIPSLYDKIQVIEYLLSVNWLLPFSIDLSKGLWNTVSLNDNTKETKNIKIILWIACLILGYFSIKWFIEFFFAFLKT